LLLVPVALCIRTAARGKMPPFILVPLPLIYISALMPTVVVAGVPVQTPVVAAIILLALVFAYHKRALGFADPSRLEDS